jgi:DNA-binding HxlR family transcriptional regulator
VHPGTVAAKSAIKALVDGWTTNIMRALAARPLSLGELDRLIASVSYPSLQRRLGAMRLVGQVEKRPGRESPYVVTDWLRRAIAPLAAAARWERRHMREQASPITSHDAEAGFLLSLPLLRLSEGLSGSCRLVVEVVDGKRLAGALAEVDHGAVVSCTSRLNGASAAWAVGPATAWLHAVLDGDSTTLELGGDCKLALALLDQMGQTLSRRGLDH